MSKNVPGSCKWCSPPSRAEELSGIQPCSHTPEPRGGDCMEIHAERRSDRAKKNKTKHTFDIIIRIPVPEGNFKGSGSMVFGVDGQGIF